MALGRPFRAKQRLGERLQGPLAAQLRQQRGVQLRLHLAQPA